MLFFDIDLFSPCFDMESPRNKGTKEQRNKGTKKQKVHPIGSSITRSPGLVFMRPCGAREHYIVVDIKGTSIAMSLKIF